MTTEGRPYVEGEKFFVSRGVCANCGGEVPLGRTHLRWTSHTKGTWLCRRPKESR
jgi:hypothetical protein